MRVSNNYKFAFLMFTLISTDIANASETIRYIYDGRGRIIRVERTGNVNNGVITNYEYDKVNNRRRVLVQGSSNSPPP